MNWYLKVLKQYVDFDGRARRKEYWMFVLFNLIFSFIFSLLDNLFDTNYSFSLSLGSNSDLGYINTIYSVFVFIPSLALLVRRLHDVGKSGWMILILFIPVVGLIWIFVLTLIDSQPGPNEWGPNPKDNNSGNTETLDGNVSF